MRPQIVSQTGVGSSPPIIVERMAVPTNIGIGCVVVGTVDYTVEHTFDDVNDTSITPTWFPHPTLANETDTADGNYAFPPRWMRITVNSGTGTVTMTTIQAGYGT